MATEHVGGGDGQEPIGMDAPSDRRAAKPRGRPPHVGLDALDLRIIGAVLSHPTRASAAAELGISEKTIQRRFERRDFREEFLRQLGELLAEQWSMMAAARVEIWDRFMAIVRSDVDANALRAAIWYFDHTARRMPDLRVIDPDPERVTPPRKLREVYERLEDGDPDEDGDAA